MTVPQPREEAGTQAPCRPSQEQADLERQILGGKIPQHVAIIMDGNGRWAQQRGLERVAGHREGVESVKDVVEAAGDLGIEVLTLYAFSTENWNRPQSEIDALMDLLVEHLRQEIDRLDEQGVQIRVLGNVSELPPHARSEVLKAIERTRHNQKLVVCLALNYGGRAEIVRAARQLAEAASNGELEPAELDEKHFEQHLYTAGLPDPDLIIRPSGEQRLSNFLLWQLAYSELYLTPVYWPDFRRQQLYLAIQDFQGRERRFGGLVES